MLPFESIFLYYSLITLSLWQEPSFINNAYLIPQKNDFSFEYDLLSYKGLFIYFFNLFIKKAGFSKRKALFCLDVYVEYQV